MPDNDFKVLSFPVATFIFYQWLPVFCTWSDQLFAWDFPGFNNENPNSQETPLSLANWEGCLP